MIRCDNVGRLAAVALGVAAGATGRPAASTLSRLAVGALIGVLALPASAAVRPAYGGSARVGAEGPAAEADPARVRTDAERLLARATSCTVGHVVAATEILDDAGRRVRLRLRDNLVFHDGTRLSAADVVRSLERVAALGRASPVGWRLLAIDAAEAGDGLALAAIGPISIELTLVAPGLDPITWLDDPGLAILRADGRTGCGPYRRADGEAAEGPDRMPPPARPGMDGIRLVPFERHPGGRPFLDALTVVPVAPGSESALDLADLDGAVGGLAGREGDVIGGGQLVLLRLEGRYRTDTGLRRSLSDAVDREGLVRFLVGGRARPVDGLAALVGDGGMAVDPAAARSGDTARPGDGGALPARLLSGYDAHHPLRRRLAERIQLRLHDRGTRVVLAPVDGRGASGANVALEVLSDLPADPALALLALAHRTGDPSLARGLFTEILEAGDDPAALALIAARLEARLGVVPLYLEPGRMRLHADLVLGAGARDGRFDPAELWRWPDDVPRPGGAAPGGW